MRNLKQQVIDAGIKLCDEGLIARTWGNVSIRTGDNHFAITASGKEYHSLTEDDIVDLNLGDLSYIGDVKPSGEKKVHQVIYKARPEAGFVIHTHQSNASAVAAMGLGKVRLLRKYPGIGSVLYCAGYGLPGTKRVARNVAKVLKESDSKAILMANHGAVCYGRDADEAFEIVKTLEEACGELLESMGIKAATGVDGEYEIKWPKKRIGVYLDDFAQLIGPYLDVDEYDPEELAEKLGEDVDAVKMVVEKNCRAGLAAIVTKGEPINIAESLLMRGVYLKKYSKLKDE